MNPLLDSVAQAIMACNRKAAKVATQAALDASLDAETVLAALMRGMEDVGQRFKANRIFVPEVLVAARAMKTSLGLLEPHLVASGVQATHKIVICTVEGDLHDIGKNLVAMMLQGANFEVIDLGTNVSARVVIDAAIEQKADLIGLSSLLTTTMPAMRDTVARIKDSAFNGPVMVGGAPVTERFAAEIAADGYSPSAAYAVDLACRLVAA